MAPRNNRNNLPIKSYTRNTSGSKTLDVLHNILTNPIQKKKSRKPKIIIKELPPPTKQTCFYESSESSLKLNANCDNTFDKLLNGTHYNKVIFKSWLKKGTSSESSLSKTEVSLAKRSPLVKLKRTRRLQCYRSPILTRSFCLRNSNSSHNEDKRLRTLEKSVNESLCIENVKISVQAPTIHFGISEGEKSSSLQQMRDCDKENSVNTSYEPIFSNTFREKYNNIPKFTIPHIENAISSTPLETLPNQKIINETIISPIPSGTNDCKLEVATTPKLKRVSKVRRSRLIDNINGDNIIDEDSSDKTDDTNKICDNLEVANKSKNDAKLFNEKAVVNLIRLSFDNLNSITHSNETEISKKRPVLKNSGRNDPKLFHKKAFVDLSRLNFDNLDLNAHWNETEISKKMPILNNSGRNNESSLNKIPGDSIQDLISEIEFQEHSMGKMIRQPLVNISNINVQDYLNHKDAVSKSLADSWISNHSGVNNIEYEINQVANTSLSRFFQNSVMNLTNMNTNILPGKSLCESIDASQNANFNKSESCNMQQSLEESSNNDTKSDCANQFIGDVKTGPVQYITLRRRQVVRNLDINKKRSSNNSRSKSKNSSGSQDISNASKNPDNEADLSSKLSNTHETVNPEHDSSPFDNPTSLSHTEMQISQNSSADLFKSFGMSENLIESDSVKINSSIVSVDRKIINLIDSSFIDTSYTELLNNRNRKLALFSLKNNKRRRNSKFGELTGICASSCYNLSSSDLVENTAIKVIKRRKVEYTGKTNNETAVNESLQGIPPTTVITDAEEGLVEFSFDTTLDGLNKNSSTPMLNKYSTLHVKVETTTETHLDNTNPNQLYPSMSVIEILDESTTEETENCNDVTESLIYKHKTSTTQNYTKLKSFMESFEEEDKIFAVSSTPPIMTELRLENNDKDQCNSRKDSANLTEDPENYADATESTISALKILTIGDDTETKSFVEVHEKEHKNLTPKIFAVPHKLQNSDTSEHNVHLHSVIEILDENLTEEAEADSTISLRKTSILQNDTKSFINNHEGEDENLTSKILTVPEKLRSTTECRLRNNDTNQSEVFDENRTKGELENHNNVAESTTRASKESTIQNRETKSVMDNHEKEHKRLSSEIFALPKILPIRKPLTSAPREGLVLKSGKSWRRSLLEVRNSKIGLPNMRRSLICVANEGDAACACDQCKRKIIEESTPRRLSVRVVPLPAARIVGKEKRNAVLADYAVSFRQSYISDVLHESLLEECFENLSLNGKNPKLRNPDRDQEYNDCREGSITARDVVLRKCGQTEALSFEKCYPNSVLQHCQKIGEGVYGEVFLFRRPLGGTSVIKVIPIEGDLIVNGERQKKFEEIISEITIAMELSDLRHGGKNRTDCFSEVRKVSCVKGKYPLRLLELWELFQEARGTENDHPDIFDDDQLFMVLELANGGSDMESFVFTSAQQAYALITQVACALAVAESSLQFEHRDLHWGNILVSSVDNDQTVSFCIDGKDVTLDTFGVRVAIIDFTLSRICSDGVCIYNDLALDPDLFTATGDYQFEIYRLMQKQNDNDWQHYEPYTNILWLHYVLDKAIKAIRYRNKTTKIHRKYLRELRELKDEVLQYKSIEAFVMAKFVDIE